MARTKSDPQGLAHNNREFAAVKLTPYQQRRREFEHCHKAWEERKEEAKRKQ